MDSEFINAFIQRQKSYIGELTSKLLVAETQLEAFQSKVNKLTEENANLLAELEKQSKKTNKTQTTPQ